MGLPLGGLVFGVGDFSEGFPDAFVVFFLGVFLNGAKPVGSVGFGGQVPLGLPRFYAPGPVQGDGAAVIGHLLLQLLGFVGFVGDVEFEWVV